MALFWFRIASSGSPPERYTLQIPFQLGPSHALTPAVLKEIAFGSLCFEIAANQGVQLLRVTGFQTASEAEAFAPRLRGALLRLIVVNKLSLRTATGFQEVRLNHPPIDIRGNPNFGSMLDEKGWTYLDGYVDSSSYRAVIIPEHLRIIELGGGSVNVTLSMPATSFLEHLAEGLALPQPQAITSNERLSLSIDLYSASLWETSQRARVISLATCLEALIRPERVDRTACEQIDELLELFDSGRDRSNEDDAHERALDRMRSRIAGLKEESISESLRRLAAANAPALGETTDDARRNMTVAYGVRSKLLHDGHAPSDEITFAAAWLSSAVPAILGSLATQAAKPN